MEENKIESSSKSKQEVKEESTEAIKEVDNITKELEELRKFKVEVEAKQRAEQEKQEEVKVSDTFFSKTENVVKEPVKELDRVWKDLMEEGVPHKED